MKGDGILHPPPSTHSSVQWVLGLRQMLPSTCFLQGPPIWYFIKISPTVFVWGNTVKTHLVWKSVRHTQNNIGHKICMSLLFIFSLKHVFIWWHLYIKTWLYICMSHIYFCNFLPDTFFYFISYERNFNLLSLILLKYKSQLFVSHPGMKLCIQQGTRASGGWER